jgi:mannose/cellobiose epimerase-like protein (N-acyl-D-glucosamine 2-epimerase family)
LWGETEKNDKGLLLRLLPGIYKDMKTEALALDERVGLIKDWLLNSGIQSEDGGFYAWQDMEDKSHSYLYSEITGYAITTMCFLYGITKDAACLNSARRAAQWIMQDALDPSGGVLTRKYVKNAVEHYSFDRGNIYSFDCAMVAFGMLKLYKATGDIAYLNCAEKIISFLNEKMLKNNGLYYPVFDAKSGTPKEDSDKWSTQSGSFHCKLALCLCDMGEIKSDPSFNIKAKRLIDASMDCFYTKGRFVTDASGGTSHLHPYSYTLEGMLYYAHKTKDDSCKDIIEKAFGWIAGLQDKDGGFPTQVFGDGKPEIACQRADIQAQILRLSYFTKSGIDREMLLERVLKMQNVSRDPKGGFLFGTDKDGSLKEHSNAWCSMFALQALYLASGEVRKDMVLDYFV